MERDETREEPTQRMPDPAEVAQDAAARSPSARRSCSATSCKRHAERQAASPFSDELGIAKAFMDLWAKLLANPMAARRRRR